MHEERAQLARQVEDMHASMPQPDPRSAPHPAAEIARTFSDGWQRVLAHLPKDVADALPDEDVKMRSVPDPGVGGTAHPSFWFGGLLVAYRDDHVYTATRLPDGSISVVTYRHGHEVERHRVPAAAIPDPQTDPPAN